MVVVFEQVTGHASKPDTGHAWPDTGHAWPRSRGRGVGPAAPGLWLLEKASSALATKPAKPAAAAQRTTLGQHILCNSGHTQGKREHYLRSRCSRRPRYSSARLTAHLRATKQARPTKGKKGKRHTDTTAHPGLVMCRAGHVQPAPVLLPGCPEKKATSNEKTAQTIPASQPLPHLAVLPQSVKCCPTQPPLIWQCCQGSYGSMSFGQPTELNSALPGARLAPGSVVQAPSLTQQCLTPL